METAIAWLALPEGASLLIEIFEDFDIETPEGGTELTQVKQSVGDRTLTLATKAARDALVNYWTTSRAGEVSNVSLVLNTNMAIGSEKGIKLPGNATGIDYWESVKNGADLGPLKTLLQSKLPDGDLKTWLASNPPDDLVRARLIDRVTWKTSQPSGPPQNAILVELIAGRLAALELPRGLAPQITSAIFERIVVVASENDPSLRRLTLRDLHAFLNEVCRLGQPGHEPGWSRASWTVGVTEIDLPAFCARRDTLLSELSESLNETGSLWLHGASGTGKSTLAQQVARASEQNWLVTEFRDQRTSSDVLLRLDRAYSDVVLSSEIGGVILDDLDTDIVAQHAARLGRFITWMRKRGASVVITSARSLSPAALQSASLSPSSVREAPYLTSEETIELVAQTRAPTDLAEAWGGFIHLSTSGGHPQLVAAKVVSLEHRSWPKNALTEDISGTPSEALELTRAEARRRLLNDATDQGRMLLKRLGCIMFKFDRASAIAIAALDPPIEDAGAILDLLTGPWIEKAPTAPGYFRLSPLLTGLQEDLGGETVQQIQSGYLVSRLKRGPIPYEALDTVFWTAFVGKQGWFISKFFENSLSFDEEKSKAIAAKLGGLVFLTTERPLLPDDPGTSHILRIMQIDVAALNSERTLFQPIAMAAVREAGEVEHEELRDAFSLMALMKILLAQGARLDWRLRLTYIAYLEALADKHPDLVNRHQGPGIDELKKEMGDDADLGAFLANVGVSAIENPDELKQLLSALDELDADLRKRRLSQLKALHKGYGLHVQSAWVRAWSAGKLDVEAAIADYEKMAALAARWRDNDLTAECIIAQSVIWDEMKGDRPKALAIVDAALETLPDHPALLRQKAKVFGHDRQYDNARDILEQIRDRTDQSSDIERMYALKEEAVATANLGDLPAARNLFLEAAAAADAVQDEVDSVRAHAIALRAEAAMCFWREGEFEQALREIAPLIVCLQNIEPEAHQAAKNLHMKLRWLVGWLHQTTGGPTGLQRELHYGALAALDTDYPDNNADQRAQHEDIKLLLTLVGLRKEVRDLFPDLNWSATTLGFHIFLAAAEFDLAVQGGNPGSIADAVLQMAASLSAALKSKAEAPAREIMKIKPIESRDLKNEAVKTVFIHALALAAFFTARDQDDPRAFCETLLAETTTRLDGLAPDLDRFTDILTGSAAADPRNHADFVFEATAAPQSDVLHPANIINRQLAILQCAIACGCGARLILKIHSLFAEEWDYVLQHQRFLLTQPSIHAPAIEAAIKYTRQVQPGALLNLLQTGARALNAEIPEAWIDIAKKLGGEPQQ
ncbi:MAG: hypothetical protein CME85_12135 [Henriciella sp.]|jgi:tetratricopeptide (TPR) repeat protein|nr:hypothetical protein [Henriciella sp.]MAN73982.1 hypothetical protein [Henriciella sp.]MBF34603.1 hypothetical protein [Hyphomonadaceae bacterium]MBK76225.1 hypothetical protein [Henriciella sp.]|tara:strand:+ start:10372 stop:14295 length:3924 start_codon:yes stop_codon:yes gene_type:complete